MEIEASLQQLGLTANEIAVYIYLLKRGLTPGAQVYRDLEMDKSSSYEALNNLVLKNLVYAVGQTRNQKFGAVAADKLYDLYLEKERQMAKVKSDIGNLVKDIDEYAKQNYKNSNIRIIEGPDGFRQWAWARLEAPKGSIIRDMSTDKLQESFLENKKLYKEYSIEMPIKRAEKGIFMHGLMKKSDLDTEIVPKSINRSDPAFLKELRYMPEEFDITATLVTFADTTSFLRKKNGEFLGVLIDDKLITNIVNQLFDFIWERSEPI